MSYSSRMRPTKGRREMSLPITFDYSGGRQEKNSTSKIWSVIITILGFIIGIGVMFNKKGFILLNILIGLLIIYVAIFIVRFFLLKEGKVRREYIKVKDSNMQFSSKNLWGIYDISKSKPYICRFRNGKSGVFVGLNKDVILGKYSDSEYEHYEAIGDAYNICGANNIQICHIDYMDNIGLDERLNDSFESLKNVDNEDVKDLLTDIYSYQKQRMMDQVTTFDVYLFLWRGSDVNAWKVIQQVINCFMQANYRSYRLYNENSLRNLTKTLLNLEEFSVVSAMLNAIGNSNSDNVVPIRVEHSDGTMSVLGKTSKEKREERELEEKRIEARKVIKSQKSNESSEDLSDEEEIDWRD